MKFYSTPIVLRNERNPIVPSSIYSCWNNPIQLDSIPLIPGRILKGKVNNINTTYSVIIKIYHNKAELEKEIGIIHRLTNSESFTPEILGISNNPTNYIVMKEFGVSLTHFFRSELSSDFQIKIATQIILSLNWLHGQNITHCDFKPDNILVQEKRGGLADVKLCDFDSATVEGGYFPSGVDENGLKMLKFTKLWVSPEVYLHNCLLQNQETREELIATRSMDIFSLGLVLVCLFNPPIATLLPKNNDSEYHESLTNPEYLRTKITNIFKSSSKFISSTQIPDKLIPLCSINPSLRCLGEFQSLIEDNNFTELQKAIVHQNEIISTQKQTINELGKKVDRLDEKADDTRAILNEIFTNVEDIKSQDGK